MNNLKLSTKIKIVRLLMEGVGIRAVNRLTGVHRDTVVRLRERLAEAAAKLMDEKMVNLSCESLQIDELYAFVGRKRRFDPNTQKGTRWIYVALDPKTKLIPSMLLGNRCAKDATRFCGEIQRRLSKDCQIHTDHLKAYVTAMERLNNRPFFDTREDEEKHHLAHIRNFGTSGEGSRTNTNHVETHNNRLRTHVSCLRRRGQLFAKTNDGLQSAVMLYAFYYNFVRPHGSLKRKTPAMAAGIASTHWTLEDLLYLAKEHQRPAPKGWTAKGLRARTYQRIMRERSNFLQIAN